MASDQTMAGQTGSTTMPGSGQHAGGGDGELNDESRRLMGAGQRLASSWMRNQKQALARRIHSSADNLRSFSNQLNDQPNIRAYVTAAAEGLDTLSSEMESRDVTELTRRAEAFARRQPVTVFAGLFVAGVLISRVLKQSGVLVMDDPSGSGMRRY